MSDLEAFLAANRANWNERVAYHVASEFYDVEGWLAEARGPRAWDRDALGDVDGLDLVHLQCHFGQDTLAWARAGANVTGLDFAADAIAAARDLAGRAGLDASFVCADVHDAVAALGNRTFDVVYVSLGALCWLPSVDRWAAVVAALLRPGGRLYLHDVHPANWAMATDEPLLEATYFEEAEALATDTEGTYTDLDAPIENRRIYEWNHSLGEIVTAVLAHGLVLDRLEEHDWTVFPRFPWLVETAHRIWTTPRDRPRLPLTFSLLAHR